MPAWCCGLFARKSTESGKQRKEELLGEIGSPTAVSTTINLEALDLRPIKQEDPIVSPSPFIRPMTRTMDMNELVRHQSLWADACTRNSATEGTKASGVSVAGRAVNFHAVTGEAATSVQHQSEFIRPGHECDETTAEDVPAPGTAV